MQWMWWMRWMFWMFWMWILWMWMWWKWMWWMWWWCGGIVEWCGMLNDARWGWILYLDGCDVSPSAPTDTPLQMMRGMRSMI
ncbi:hypothetical protein BZA05DRAFT_392379, partial [Tricharina praecox]|uniref:uncharacterized protein n=1 Tax=Tricharina praecox TaxID=43433 RepID=UPI00221FA2D1